MDGAVPALQGCYEFVERPVLTNSLDLRAALDQVSKRLESSPKLSNAEKRHIADTVYVVAYMICRDDDLWQAFCEFPEWNGKSRKPLFKPESREDALYFVSSFVSRGKTAHATWLRRLLGRAWDAKADPRLIVARIWKIQQSRREKVVSQRVKQNLQKLSFRFAPNEFVAALNQKSEKHRIILDVSIDADRGERTRDATIMGIKPFKKRRIAAVKCTS